MGRFLLLLLLCALLFVPVGAGQTQSVFFSQLLPQLTPQQFFGEATPGEAVAL